MPSPISFPFRLNSNGSIVTSDEGSSELFGELLAVLIMTKPFERDLVPDFGIEDMAYEGFDQTELEVKLEMFGPPVTITNVESSYPRDGINDVEIGFELLADEEEVLDEDEGLEEF
jgi:hypothetical protein